MIGADERSFPFVGGTGLEVTEIGKLVEVLEGKIVKSGEVLEDEMPLVGLGELDEGEEGDGELVLLVV